MKINKNNYELYILSHYEGSLTKSEEQELLLFIAKNPDVKEEFDSFQNIKIVPDDNIKFDLKLALKQKGSASNNILINENNYKEYFIASIEGDLDAGTQKQLNAFLQNYPSLEDEYNQYASAKLTPDFSIKYENKRGLKKFTLDNGIINKKVIYSSVSIAVSFLILISVALFIKDTQTNNINTISTNTNTKTAEKTSKNIASIIDIPVIKHIIKPNKLKPTINNQNNKVEYKRENIEINTIEPRNLTSIKTQDNINNNNLEIRNNYTNISYQLVNYDEQNNNSGENNILKNIQYNKLIRSNGQFANVENFIYNTTNKGYAKIMTFTNSVKNKYKSIEQKLASR